MTLVSQKDNDQNETFKTTSDIKEELKQALSHRSKEAQAKFTANHRDHYNEEKELIQCMETEKDLIEYLKDNKDNQNVQRVGLVNLKVNPYELAMIKLILLQQNKRGLRNFVIDYVKKIVKLKK